MIEPKIKEYINYCATVLKIKEYVNYFATVLKIEPPAVVVVPSTEMPTATTIAALSDDGKRIGVNSEFLKTLERNRVLLVVTTAHECRHAWQIKHKKVTSQYKSSIELERNMIHYNLQDEEVDAWAWSFIMAEQYCEDDDLDDYIDMIFEKIGDMAADKIEARMDEIYEQVWAEIEESQTQLN